jgi:ATP-dependent Lon protease
MQESAKIGLSVIKDNSKKWNIDSEFFKNKRLHIHAPAGAVPKDGPSAGVALVSSMVSLMKNQRIKDCVAMTGEVTLSGKVWPVGGIKEKVLAAIRSGIKTVILPKDNKKDFEDIPKYLTEKIKPVYVSSVGEVFKEIF